MTRAFESRKLITAGAVSLIFVLTLTATTRALAGETGASVPFQFQAGQPARADEVNQNFELLVSLVEEGRIQREEMQVQIDSLQVQLAESQELTQFMSTISEEINGLAGPHLIIEDANVHIRSGSGATDDGGALTGLGNLVIGYNEEANNQAGGDRDGAHNLVVGRRHKYPNMGGIVAGETNTISGAFASVLAGSNNKASGNRACVSGGSINQASGEDSSVSGGMQNVASGSGSSASGGSSNTASGFVATISGGFFGLCDGTGASISGGQQGVASGSQSSITGGYNNSAFGPRSTVSGGNSQAVNDSFEWRACDLTCP